MKRYSLHNLIDVDVDPRVPRELAKAIKFQLAHFRVGADAPLSPTRITVHPYRLFHPHRVWASHEFHLCRGGAGKWIDMPERRTAYVRDKRGYTVFADTPSFLVNMLIQALLVERGITLIHAAAVADRAGRVTLLPGPGGVGKTALLGELVKHHGYKMLGDDIVAITSKGECLSFPRSFVLKEYHRSVYPEIFTKLKLDRDTPGTHTPQVLRTLLNFAVDNMPLKGIARTILRKSGHLRSVQQSLAGPHPEPYLATVSVANIFGADAVLGSGPIDRILFLERWNQCQFDLSVMSVDSMARRLFAIIHHEWVGHMQDFWSLGSMELIDLPKYFSRMEGTIQQVVGSRRCEKMLVPHGAAPSDLIEAFLNHRIAERRAA